MRRNFILYVNDNYIKVYHANSKIISFYKKYSIEHTASVTGFVSLMKKYSHWNMYVMFDTSEMLIEKKIFAKKNVKDINAIIKNYSQNPDCLLSAVLPNEPDDVRSRSSSKEYVTLSIGNGTYPALQAIIDAISIGSNKVRVVNFLPICIANANIVQLDQNTINTFVRIRKDNTYAIDVYYGKSFVLHREGIIDTKIGIKQEIVNTISYVETIITNTNVFFVTTILNESSFAKEEFSGIKSDKLSVINAQDIGSFFQKTIRIAKNSDSEIDDTMLSIIFGKRAYHANMSNNNLNKKRLFFKLIPYSYAAIVLFFIGLIGTELSNIFIKLPETMQKVSQAEREFRIIEAKLAKLKKTSINEEALAYIKACAKMERVDEEKASYLPIVQKLNNIANQYNNKALFRGYKFNCSSNCFNKKNADFSMSAVITLFNDAGDYESMVKLIKQLSEDIAKELSDYNISTPLAQDVQPKIGAKYYNFVFNLTISKNASKSQ